MKTFKTFLFEKREYASLDISEAVKIAKHRYSKSVEASKKNPLYRGIQRTTTNFMMFTPGTRFGTTYSAMGPVFAQEFKHRFPSAPDRDKSVFLTSSLKHASMFASASYNVYVALIEDGANFASFPKDYNFLIDDAFDEVMRPKGETPMWVFKDLFRSIARFVKGEDKSKFTNNTSWSKDRAKFLNMLKIVDDTIENLTNDEYNDLVDNAGGELSSVLKSTRIAGFVKSFDRMFDIAFRKVKTGSWNGKSDFANEVMVDTPILMIQHQNYKDFMNEYYK